MIFAIFILWFSHGQQNLKEMSRIQEEGKS